MSPDEIKIEIYKLKLKKVTSITKIASTLGCTYQAVTSVIERRSVSKRIMEAIAYAIGGDREHVFPEYVVKNPTDNCIHRFKKQPISAQDRCKQ